MQVEQTVAQFRVTKKLAARQVMMSWKECWTFATITWLIFLSSLCSAAVTTPNAKDSVEVEASSVVPRYTDENLVKLCPNMIHQIFNGAMPSAEDKAGLIEEFPLGDKENDEADVNLRDCITACCEKNQQNQTCNVVFVFKLKCYHVRCVSNEACLPKKRSPSKQRLQMVLVNPVQQQLEEGGGEIASDLSWLDVLKNEKLGVNYFQEEDITAAAKANPLSFWKQSHKYRYPPRIQEPPAYDEEGYPITEKRMKQLITSMNDGVKLTPEDVSFYGANMPVDASAAPKFNPCSLDDSDVRNRCSAREECVPSTSTVRTNTGICQCVRGYERNLLGECVNQDLDYQTLDTAIRGQVKVVGADSAALPITDSQTGIEPEVEVVNTQKEDESKQIVVTVASKEVRLPEKEAALVAYTVPEEKPTSKYSYLWTLVTQPKGPMNGTISEQTKSKVQLSNLSEGVYTFKVSVTGTNGTFGEAMANVTVLPEKRINKVPQVVIIPREQTIRQPTKNAVLDGSTSTDDDRIIGWQWEVISGPIGYQPKLPAGNTLQLTDLTSPGNYTFQLTVTDSNNVTNSSTANVTVLKGTDYPPVANAGDAVILYLPNNNVTLNGTASSDDHEIVAWEWTKDASDQSKAVDMQNTRTPYAQLSNLEEGMYTFVLKVTDGSGQSSSAKVHVLVKPQTNSPPVAVAGVNTTINLPCNWVLLNGSQSVDDIRIERFFWQQRSGPNSALIANANASIANATSLTLGLYEFKLSVVDESNNTAVDSVWVKVVQEKNSVPVANAGGDLSVTLPVSAIYLNGSKSWDDLAVVNYTWKRDGTSLAMGHVVGNTDQAPVLILSDLVTGRYVFKLTVTDEQGLSSTDTATVIVHPDPLLMNLVEITLSAGGDVLTQSELESVVQKISLLLGDMKVHVRDLKYDVQSERAILVFYVEDTTRDGKSENVNGLKVEQQLKEKFQRDASILGTVFSQTSDVRTTVCQYKCSGHGVCNSNTRTCICEAFWMPSALFFWGVVEANCDWSILYVFVFVIVGLFLLSGIFWGIACTCRQNKKPRTRPKIQKYSLIGTQDEEAPQFHRTTSLTDSDTDSDVLFETRSKPNGILRSNGVAKRNKNSHAQNSYASKKLGRRIRT